MVKVVEGAFVRQVWWDHELKEFQQERKGGKAYGIKRHHWVKQDKDACS